MGIMKYSISQIVIDLQSPHEIKQTDSFKPFETEEQETYSVEFVPVEEIALSAGKEIERSPDYIVMKENDRYHRYFYDGCSDDEIYAKSQWDWKRKKVIINFLPRYKKFFSESGNSLFHIGLEQILLRENRLIFHAACVEMTYGGILFTGPSGVGKSTQADLWVQHRDAFLINGDRPILQKCDMGWKAWGSPYAGSSKCYVNKSCEVRAIVRVIQALQNRVNRLRGGQAFSTVFAGVTVNDWSREDVNLASDLVIELLGSIPVYELYCTKTAEAVEVLEAALKGDGIL